MKVLINILLVILVVRWQGKEYNQAYYRTLATCMSIAKSIELLPRMEIECADYIGERKRK